MTEMEKDLNPVAKPKEYQTVIGNRNPKQKLHATLGHAKAAIVDKINPWGNGATCDMQVLAWVESAQNWAPLYTIKEGDLEAPWREHERREAAAKAYRKREREQARMIAEGRRLAAIEAEKYPYECSESPFELYQNAYLAGYMEAMRDE